MKKEFEDIHKSMRCNSDELACDAVFKVIHRSCEDNSTLESTAQIESAELETPEDSNQAVATQNLKEAVGDTLESAHDTTESPKDK